MTHDIFEIEYDGPEQCRRPVLFRLFDGTVLTVETAIAMARYHSGQFRQWTAAGWKNLTPIPNKLGTFSFDL